MDKFEPNAAAVATYFSHWNDIGTKKWLTIESNCNRYLIWCFLNKRVLYILFFKQKQILIQSLLLFVHRLISNRHVVCVLFSAIQATYLN